MEATATVEPRTEPTATSVTGWPLRMAGVLAFAAVLFFARLGERALWSEEVRWLQIPREMQQSGDWLWPTINGKTYYDKPLGSYWLVLLSSCVTGTLDEHAARLPSAVCGLLGVAFVMLIARRLGSDTSALLAGLVLASSFSFVFFARTASTDVETVTGILAALWVFLKYQEGPSGWWIIALWLAMALTSLTKGLLGFALPILIIGVYALAVARVEKPLPPSRSMRGWLAWLIEVNRWLIHPVSLVAIPLALLVYLAPFLLSDAVHGSADGLAMVYRENIRRFFDPVNHRGPIYLYTYIIFMLLAPWSLLLPAALVHAHFGADKYSKGRLFALAYFWATFIFFTLSASRRSYYLLPIVPAAALLIAQLLTTGAPLRPVTSWLVRAGFAVLSAVVVVSAAALLPVTSMLPEPWNRLPELPSRGCFVIAWLVSLGAIVYAWLRLEPGRIAWAFGAVAAAFMLYLYVGALPELEGYRTQKPFAEAVKRAAGAVPSKLALHGTREIVGNLDWPAPIAEHHTPDELREAIRAGAVRWLIVRRRDWENLTMAGAIVVAETVQPWEDVAQAQSKLLLVELDAR